jgi:hypothetical protein
MRIIMPNEAEVDAAIRDIKSYGEDAWRKICSGSTYDRMKAIALLEKAEWLKPMSRPDGTTAPLYLTQNVYTDTFRETVPQADNTVDTDSDPAVPARPDLQSG